MEERLVTMQGHIALQSFEGVDSIDSTTDKLQKLSLESKASAEVSSKIEGKETAVKVIIRVRPLNQRELSENATSVVWPVSDSSLQLRNQLYTYDSIAGPDTTQKEIFHLVGESIVENCLAGFNSSILAYGQTGSGKTHTMLGISQDKPEFDENVGLIPRVFQRLFTRIKEDEEKNVDSELKFSCKCSFLEIYNEQIMDLLDPSQKNLQLREDTRLGVYVENLSCHLVNSIADVERLLVQGSANRKVASTAMNLESSRSHSVFSCSIASESKSKKNGVSAVRFSRLSLVDLAGSERQKLTQAGGDRLREAGSINKSLSQLGNVIKILAEIAHSGKQRHVPYRDSKLTFLLQDSLGGNAKTVMLCNVSPASINFPETLSTLKFAQRARAVQNKAVVNLETSSDVNSLQERIRQLQEEITQMKAQQSPPPAVRRAKIANRTPSPLREAEGENVVENDENDPKHMGSGKRKRVKRWSETDLEEEEEMRGKQENEEKIKASESLLAQLKKGLTEGKSGEFNGKVRRESGERSPLQEVETLPENIYCRVVREDEGSDYEGKENETSPGGAPKPVQTESPDISKLRPPQANEMSPAGQIALWSPGEGGKREIMAGGGDSEDKMKVEYVVSLEKLLAGAIRREKEGEKAAVRMRAEVDQLNKLVLQLRREREYNEAMQVSREERLGRLEALANGLIPSETFLGQEWSNMMYQRKLLQEQMSQNPETAELKVEIQRLKDEVDVLRTFCKDGEREDLITENQQLKCHLLKHLESQIVGGLISPRPSLSSPERFLSRPPDSRRKSFGSPGARNIGRSPLGQAESLPEGGEENGKSADSVDSDFWIQKEKEWMERDDEWSNLVESQVDKIQKLQTEVDKLKTELETEKCCTKEAQDAISRTFESYRKIVDQYDELHEKHVALLAKQRKIVEGAEIIKSEAKKFGISNNGIRWIENLAAKVAKLETERDNDRQESLEEISGLRSQLQRTAETASDVLKKLEESEEIAKLSKEAAQKAEQQVATLKRDYGRIMRRQMAERAEMEQHLKEAVEDGHGVQGSSFSSLCASCGQNVKSSSQSHSQSQSSAGFRVKKVLAKVSTKFPPLRKKNRSANGHVITLRGHDLDSEALTEEVEDLDEETQQGSETVSCGGFYNPDPEEDSKNHLHNLEGCDSPSMSQSWSRLSPGGSTESPWVHSKVEEGAEEASRKEEARKDEGPKVTLVFGSVGKSVRGSEDLGKLEDVDL